MTARRSGLCLAEFSAAASPERHPMLAFSLIPG